MSIGMSSVSERGRLPQDSTLRSDGFASEGSIGKVDDHSPPPRRFHTGNSSEIGDVQATPTAQSADSTRRPNSLPPRDSSQREIQGSGSVPGAGPPVSNEVGFSSSLLSLSDSFLDVSGMDLNAPMLPDSSLGNSSSPSPPKETVSDDQGTIQSIDGRSLSTSPDKKSLSPPREEGGETTFRPRNLEKGSLPTFADTLAAVTMRAPEKLADKLVDRLQQTCQEDAASGRAYAVFDAALPLSRRFSDAVAREFAAKLKDLGFVRFEWWSGKDWREMPGRYIILHDTMYDKYTIRVRVHWPEGLTAKDMAETEAVSTQGRSEDAEADDPTLQALVQQMQQVLAMQTEIVFKSVAALESAEARAERAEARALAAENHCLGSMGIVSQSTDIRRPILQKSATGEYLNRHRSCFAGCWEAFGTRPSRAESRRIDSTSIQANGSAYAQQAKAEAELDSKNGPQVQRL